MRWTGAPFPRIDAQDPKVVLKLVWNYNHKSINNVKFATKPYEGATRAVYSYEVPFVPSIAMVDIQLNHAIKASLPSNRFPGEEGWYYNIGDKAGTTEEMFTIAELIGSGH